MRKELSPVHLRDGAGDQGRVSQWRQCAILAIQRNLAWTTLLEKSISKIALYMSRAMRGSFTATVTIGSPGSEKNVQKFVTDFLRLRTFRVEKLQVTSYN